METFAPAVMAQRKVERDEAARRQQFATKLDINGDRVWPNPCPKHRPGHFWNGHVYEILPTPYAAEFFDSAERRNVGTNL
jgi:hypothetical protein